MPHACIWRLHCVVGFLQLTLDGGAGDVPKANHTTIRAEMVRNCDIIQAPVAETYNSLTVRQLTRPRASSHATAVMRVPALYRGASVCPQDS